MPVAVCIPLDDIESALGSLKVAWPGLGELEKLRDSLRDLPDPSKLILNFFDILNALLAPLQPLFTAVELAAALYNCVRATIDAIQQLNPQPLTDCISNLTEIIARILQFLPPFVYLRVIADILLIFIRFMDQLAGVLRDIDEQITDIATVIARGTAIGDANLVILANCSKDEVRAVGNNVIFALQSVGRLIGLIQILLAILISIARGDLTALDDATRQNNALAARMNQVAANMATSDLPVLGDLVDVIVQMRGLLVFFYRIAAAPLGQEIQDRLNGLPLFSPPTLANP